MAIFSQGQLGHGCVDNEEQPRVVVALEGISVTNVSAGGWHSTALSGKCSGRCQAMSITALSVSASL